jgi:hypothetical protein
MANDLVAQATAMDSFIERAAMDPSFDIAKFEVLLRMQREIMDQQARRQFNASMSEAQAEMMPVIRGATNTHTNSKYAKLETIDRDMRPIYTRHGFSVRYGSASPLKDGWIRITCTVAHSGGYFEEHYLDAQLDTAGSKGTANKPPIQAVGSSVTYLRRYLLTMVFNIVLADDDDDGEATRQQPRREVYQNAPGQPPPQADPLDEANPTMWLKNLDVALANAPTLDALHSITRDKRVVKALAEAPTLIRARISDMMREAHERLAPTGEAVDRPFGSPDNTVEGLMAEIGEMDLISLSSLDTSATWRERVRAACSDFPADLDRFNEAIEARKLELRRR